MSSSNFGSCVVPTSVSRVDDVRRVALGVAVLARLHVEHELRERAVQPREAAAQEREARAGELGGGREVEQAERLAEVGVIRDREVERARRAPAAHLDVVVGRLADRRRRRAGGSAGRAGSRAARACTRSSSPSRRFVSSPMPADLGQQRGRRPRPCPWRRRSASTARCAAPAAPACASGCPCARARAPRSARRRASTPRLREPGRDGRQIVAEEIDVEHARNFSKCARAIAGRDEPSRSSPRALRSRARSSSSFSRIFASRPRSVGS